jgi:hypothetical protein
VDLRSESDPDSRSTNSEAHNTFVVRIWSSDGSELMRGHVQHIRSRRRAYFATRQRLLSFIQDYLPVAPRADAEADR